MDSDPSSPSGSGPSHQPEVSSPAPAEWSERDGEASSSEWETDSEGEGEEEGEEEGEGEEGMQITLVWESGSEGEYSEGEGEEEGEGEGEGEGDAHTLQAELLQLLAEANQQWNDEDSEVEDTVMELEEDLRASPHSKTFLRGTATNIFRVKTSSNHFQCANNIVVPDFEQNHHVFFYFRKKICCYNMFTNKNVEEFSFNLSFPPICLTVHYGLVVAGGMNGEIAIFNLEEKKFEMHKTPMKTLLNSVEIIFHQGQQKLVVADNDGRISVYSLPQMERDTLIGNFPAAVNACKMSPDGKFLGVVGDFEEIFLVPITEKGFLPFEPLPKDSSPSASSILFGDLSRSVSDEERQDKNNQYLTWNLTSTLLAATTDTQSYISIFNINTRTLIARVEAGAHTFPIHFSMSQPEVLFFANRRSFLHVVDIRTFQRQIIHVAHSLEISGFCFSPDFRRVYVALPNQIMEFEINGTKSLLESCVSVVQRNPKSFEGFDWKLLPHEILVRIFPYNSLEKQGKLEEAA